MRFLTGWSNILGFFFLFRLFSITFIIFFYVNPKAVFLCTCVVFTRSNSSSFILHRLSLVFFHFACRGGVFVPILTDIGRFVLLEQADEPLRSNFRKRGRGDLLCRTTAKDVTSTPNMWKPHYWMNTMYSSKYITSPGPLSALFPYPLPETSIHFVLKVFLLSCILHLICCSPLSIK